MMNLRLPAFIFAFIIALTPAYAQWQVDSGAVPLGRGVGQTGFSKAAGASGAGTKCLTDTTPPSFTPCGSGGGVSSLNGLTGSITLLPGTGVNSITPAGSNVTINAKNSGCLNILDYGGVGDDTTLNDIAFNSAFSAIPTSGNGCIYFPPGTYKFTARINKTLSTGSSMLTIRGDGPRVSELHFPNASGGIRIARAEYRNAIVVQDISITTGQVGVANGLDIDGTGFTTIGNSPWNTISNVLLSGDDWRTTATTNNCWGVNIHIKVWGQFNLYNVNTSGNATLAGCGTGLVIEGDAATSLYGILYNINQSSFNYHAIGFLYGDWVQGVTINQTNFNGANNSSGIFAGGGYTGVLSQLAVSNSQFGLNGSALSINSTIFDVQLTNNLLQSVTTGTIIVDLPLAFGVTVVGNKFYTFGTNPGIVGIHIGGQGEGTIVGNYFKGIATGVNMSAGVSGMTVGLNSFVTVTTKVAGSYTPASNSVGSQAVGVMSGVVP